MSGPTREEVERLADRLEGTPLYEGCGEESDMPEAAATMLRALRDRAEAAKAERDKCKFRGDNHWETMRCVYRIAKEEGDMAAVIQHIEDAGSGYTERPEETLRRYQTDLAAAKAALTEARAEIERLTKERDALAAAPSDGTCVECGCAPTNAEGLCATCVDGRALTPPADATAALQAVKDAEWDAAIEEAAQAAKDAAKPFARAFILRRLSGTYNVSFRAKQRMCIRLSHAIRALRRNPKEGVA